MTDPRPAHWQHVITDAGHHLRLAGADGEPILTSEVYTEGEQVHQALYLVRKAINSFSSHDPDVVDERTTFSPPEAFQEKQ